MTYHQPSSRTKNRVGQPAVPPQDAGDEICHTRQNTKESGSFYIRQTDAGTSAWFAARGNKWKKLISSAALLLLLAILLFFVKAYKDGQFRSAESLRDYIRSFGVMGPAVLTTFQALQVIVPVLPGFVGCAAGALLFGASGGFWYNYLGISAGSLIAFFLARQFGVSLVKTLFPGDKYEKWAGWLGKSRYFSLLLFAAILLPLAPDDYLCYFSGLTTMSRRKFFWIILLGKPWCILAYSLVFAGIL